VATISFLGTGNYLAPAGRYWNSFVLDGRVLVEPAPTALPHLRRCGFAMEQIDAVAISHFHADHTFGWPFVLLEALTRGRDRPLHVIGPPGVRDALADMMRVGNVPNVQTDAHNGLDIQYIDITGSWQQAGSLRVRGIEVEHVPYLRCFGYLFACDGVTVGYSGDTRPCDGIDEIAAAANVLVLECNGPHPPPPTHMDVDDVRDLHARYPDTRLNLTHLGADVTPADVADLPAVTVPADFDSFDV